MPRGIGVTRGGKRPFGVCSSCKQRPATCAVEWRGVRRGEFCRECDGFVNELKAIGDEARLDRGITETVAPAIPVVALGPPLGLCSGCFEQEAVRLLDGQAFCPTCVAA